MTGTYEPVYGRRTRPNRSGGTRRFRTATQGASAAADGRTVSRDRFSTAGPFLAGTTRSSYGPNRVPRALSGPGRFPGTTQTCLGPTILIVWPYLALSTPRIERFLIVISRVSGNRFDIYPQNLQCTAPTGLKCWFQAIVTSTDRCTGVKVGDVPATSIHRTKAARRLIYRRRLP